MVFYLGLDRHPVYQSLISVLRSTKITAVKEIDYNKYLSYVYRGKTFHIQKLSIALSKRHVYVLNSPLMELKTWEGLLKKISMIFVEEYYEKNIVKDAIVSILLAPFKNYPFIALTKRTYNFLKKRRFKVFFIPPAEKRRKINKKREYILFVGRLCKSKNPELIISLAREIKNENFLVIGKGEFSDLIKKASQELKNLKYIEYVEEREKLFEYYANAKILLHPALSDPVGFVVVEALSTSTPVLVSSSTGVADFLPKDWVIDKPDVQKWIEKIEQMTRNLDKNIKLAESTFENEHLNLDDRYFDEIAKGIEKQQNSFLPTHSIYQ